MTFQVFHDPYEPCRTCPNTGLGDIELFYDIIFRPAKIENFRERLIIVFPLLEFSNTDLVERLTYLCPSLSAC